METTDSKEAEVTTNMDEAGVAVKTEIKEKLDVQRFLECEDKK